MGHNLFIGEISALTAALLWSNASIIFTAATIKLGPIQLNVDRMALATLLLAITIMILGLSYSVTSYQLLMLTLSGIVGLVVGDSFLFKSFSAIGPRMTMLVYSVNPAIAGILAYFVLGEVMSTYAIIGIVVTLCGIFIVIIDRKPSTGNRRFQMTAKGLMYALLGAAGQGIGLILAKMAYSDGDIHSITATFVRIASSVVFLLPAAFFIGRYKNPVKLYSRDKKTFGLVALGSVIGPYLGITLSFIALTNTQVGIAATLMSTVPIMILPVTYIFYKEKINARALIGASISVIGVAMLFLT